MNGAGGFDWQFVAVTLAALWGGWVLLRPLWRDRGSKKPTGACGRCSSADCTKQPDAGGSAAGLVRIGRGK